MLSGGGVKIKLEDFQPVHEDCTGCAKIVNDGELGFERCRTYVDPASWWINDKYCPLIEKETLSTQDVVNMAIEAKIIEKDGGKFTYANYRTPSLKDIVNLLRHNRNLYTEIKRKLGIVDVTEKKGRIGQQKQRKKRF